jgi:D-alanine-D-alanine ligase
MKIGLAYDLRQEYLDLGYGLEETAEFDRPDTIDAIERELVELGHFTERIGSFRSLLGALAEGRRWDMVFNVSEGLYGLGRESLVPCLLDAYEIPYTFSDPMVLALSLHKGMCKRIIRDMKIPTSDFFVVETEKDVAGVDLDYPIFVKPVAEGTGKGVDSSSRINSADQLAVKCRDLLGRYGQPVLVESYLPGEEFTAGIVGTGEAARVLGVLEVCVKTDDAVYSYESKEYCEEMVDYLLYRGDKDLEREISKVALASWRGLGCRDAGRVDLKLDRNGSVMFVEMNPLAGLNPVHSDLPIMCNQMGIPFHDLIAWIMDSAMERVKNADSGSA